jgi:hypothetical protein
MNICLSHFYISFIYKNHDGDIDDDGEQAHMVRDDFSDIDHLNNFKNYYECVVIRFVINSYEDFYSFCNIIVGKSKSLTHVCILRKTV